MHDIIKGRRKEGRIALIDQFRTTIIIIRVLSLMYKIIKGGKKKEELDNFEK